MTLAQILRQKADALQAKIDHCFRDRQTNTRSGPKKTSISATKATRSRPSRMSCAG
jgi:hypothetical protein